MPGLTKDAAYRTGLAVKWWERRPRFKLPGLSGSAPTDLSKYMLVTQAITARNGLTLGQGMGTAYTIAVKGATATLVAGSDAFPIFNGGGTTIAAGRVIQVKSIDGTFNVDVDYC